LILRFPESTTHSLKQESDMDKRQLFENRRKVSELGYQRLMLHVHNNHFDKISNEAIVKNEAEIKQLQQKGSKNSDQYWDIYFLEEELMAITEMKIVYAYKHFETSLKILLKSLYRDLDSSKLFRWETIAEILKVNKIDIRTVDCYGEIDQIREVNNAIKHSGILQARKLPIEFKNKTSISYQDLLQFYSRVEYAPEKFLESLHKKINNALYFFDDHRLKTMVKEIEDTMHPDTAIKFAQLIIENYS